jgi:hypothetical protein
VVEVSKRLGGYSTGQQPLGVGNIHLGWCPTTLGDLMVIWLGECSPGLVPNNPNRLGEHSSGLVPNNPWRPLFLDEICHVVMRPLTMAH